MGWFHMLILRENLISHLWLLPLCTVYKFKKTENKKQNQTISSIRVLEKGEKGLIPTGDYTVGVHKQKVNFRSSLEIPEWYISASNWEYHLLLGVNPNKRTSNENIRELERNMGWGAGKYVPQSAFPSTQPWTRQVAHMPRTPPLTFKMTGSA